jgi:carbonic anhydrase/acetyltransferase-like protein (isoleucine patch superfamily)
MSQYVLPYDGIVPQLAEDVWLAPSANVIGDVTIGRGSNVWYNTVLRGDVHHIRIGEMTNIQDGTVGHNTYQKFPLIVGNRVTIGHNATIHACTIEDKSLIGMGATVLDGATVQTRSMVAAGGVVSPGKVVESGWLWGGIPAKPLRKLTEDELPYFNWSAEHYYKLAMQHRAALSQG